MQHPCSPSVFTVYREETMGPWLPKEHPEKTDPSLCLAYMPFCRLCCSPAQNNDMHITSKRGNCDQSVLLVLFSYWLSSKSRLKPSNDEKCGCPCPHPSVAPGASMKGTFQFSPQHPPPQWLTWFSLAEASLKGTFHFSALPTTVAHLVLFNGGLYERNLPFLCPAHPSVSPGSLQRRTLWTEPSISLPCRPQWLTWFSLAEASMNGTFHFSALPTTVAHPVLFSGGLYEGNIPFLCPAHPVAHLVLFSGDSSISLPHPPPTTLPPHWLTWFSLAETLPFLCPHHHIPTSVAHLFLFSGDPPISLPPPPTTTPPSQWHTWFSLVETLPFLCPHPSGSPGSV